MMTKAAKTHSDASGLLKRSLDQAARELLLAQASDWSFMMKAGNAAEFAKGEFTGHMKNFLALHRELSAGGINVSNLAAIELKNNIFRDMDFRVYLNDRLQPSSLSKG
jgi:1,4-alpha-glucan branching enzyme